MERECRIRRTVSRPVRSWSTATTRRCGNGFGWPSDGVRPGPSRAAYIECATQYAVLEAADHENVDLFILDGEAVPAGGMGLCRQLKDEIYRCPPVIVLIARRDDGWLATWSRADATVLHPVDGVRLTPVVVDLLRRRS